MKSRIVRSLGRSWVLALVAVAASSGGAPPDVELEPLVVTARGRDTRLSHTPGGIGVVAPEDILAHQPVSIGDIALRIPGVDKTGESAWGSELSIRGLGRNRVIFLVDGARVNTATDLNAQYGTVDTFDVERIEVLKGPISALYGSGSIGGVVNAIPRKGAFADTPEWRGRLTSTYHSNPAGPGMHGDVSYNTSSFWGYASGSWRDRDSYKDADGDTVRNSQFRDGHGTLRLGWKWDAAQVTELGYQHHRARQVGVPGAGTASLPAAADVTFPQTTRTLLSLTHSVTPEGMALRESRVTLFHQKVERRAVIDNLVGGPLRELRPEADHDTYGMKWLNIIELAPHTLTAGIDAWDWHYSGTRTRYFRDGRIGVDTPLADSRQLSAGVFAENDWRTGERVTVNVGGRIDVIHSTSDELYDWLVPPGAPPPAFAVATLKRPSERNRDVSWNAHAGLTWTLAEAWSLTTIAASSYRTPDLMDRYKYLNLGGAGELYGNPELDPERSLFVEQGLHYNAARLRAAASVFCNLVDDLIIDPGPAGTVRQMQNVDQARLHGFELEGEWRFLPNWAGFANLAYVKGRNRSTGDNLPFVPPLNGLAGVRYEHPRGFWCMLELDWAANTGDVAPGEARTDRWATVNASLGYRLARGRLRHEVLLGVDNLGNADYRNHLSTSRGFELKEPGRNLRAAYRVEF